MNTTNTVTNINIDKNDLRTLLGLLKDNGLEYVQNIIDNNENTSLARLKNKFGNNLENEIKNIYKDYIVFKGGALDDITAAPLVADATSTTSQIKTVGKEVGNIGLEILRQLLKSQGAPVSSTPINSSYISPQTAQLAASAALLGLQKKGVVSSTPIQSTSQTSKKDINLDLLNLYLDLYKQNKISKELLNDSLTKLICQPDQISISPDIARLLASNTPKLDVLTNEQKEINDLEKNIVGSQLTNPSLGYSQSLKLINSLLLK